MAEEAEENETGSVPFLSVFFFVGSPYSFGKHEMSMFRRPGGGCVLG